jgi:hypothetical protein
MNTKITKVETTEVETTSAEATKVQAEVLIRVLSTSLYTAALPHNTPIPWCHLEKACHTRLRIDFQLCMSRGYVAQTTAIKKYCTNIPEAPRRWVLTNRKPK